MKILIVTTAFPRWQDDTKAPFILEAAKALRRQGNNVRVLAMHHPGSRKYENWDGIEIYRPPYLPYKWEILQSEGGGIPEVWKKSKFSIAVIIPFLIIHSINIIRLANDCEIIHANWTLSAFAAWATRWFHKKPMFATVQGSDIFQAAKMPFVRKITRITLNGMKAVFALSRALAQEVSSIGVSTEKTIIIPNGVDIRNFKHGHSNRENIILFVGSLINRKGPTVLLEAFLSLLEQTPSAKLYIIGEGPLHNQLEGFVAKNNLTSNVHFLGSLPQEQVGQWMRMAKVFVLPSLEEGLGVVLLEALASGTPCIGSEVGGIPDVINNDVGKLIPPNDPIALKNALSEILNDEDKWKSMSEKARQTAEDIFDWDQIAAKIIDSYQKSLN